MVRGKNDDMYQTLLNRFLEQQHESFTEDNEINIDTLLTVWEEDGLENAVQLYFNLKNKNAKRQS